MSLRYEPDSQEDVIWIARGGSPFPEAVLACLAQTSLAMIHEVYFRDETEQLRYRSILNKISDEVEVADARSWLRERNMFSSAPVPMTDEPLAGFTVAVEGFCGVKPGSLLATRDEHTITFARGGVGTVTQHGVKDEAASADQFECVMRVMASADLRSRGVFFGFVGNEAVIHH